MNGPEFISRLERLKELKQWSWAEAAEAVGLSRSMVHFIKTGKYGVSETVSQQLRKAERDAGISPRARVIIEAIVRQAEQAKINVSRQDVAAGKKVVEVQFITGEPPTGVKGNRIELSRPDVRVSAKLVADMLVDEGYESVLVSCLPTDLANRSFLNSLTPFSYKALCDAAMVLVFGVDWQRRLPELES